MPPMLKLTFQLPLALLPLLLRSLRVLLQNLFQPLHSWVSLLLLALPYYKIKATICVSIITLISSLMISLPFLFYYETVGSSLNFICR
ncbi:hypothetical protein SCEN_B01910 [Saccharomyces cerevisiae]|nr:hypothetical protein SCEN_B01910 [Saccharomyces cerevisiae]